MLGVGAGFTAQIGLTLFAWNLTRQIRKLEGADEAAALKLFRANGRAGFLLFAGLLTENMMFYLVEIDLLVADDLTLVAMHGLDAASHARRALRRHGGAAAFQRPAALARLHGSEFQRAEAQIDEGDVASGPKAMRGNWKKSAQALHSPAISASPADSARVTRRSGSAWSRATR